MPRRFPLERKFRIDPILNERWKEMIPPRFGDSLIRAMMNKLVEEVRGGRGGAASPHRGWELLPSARCEAEKAKV